MGWICLRNGTTAISLGAGPASFHPPHDSPSHLWGAYAYGKTGVAWGYVGSGQHVGRRRKLRSEWLVQRRRA